MSDLCILCAHNIDNQESMITDFTECEQCTQNINCVYDRFTLREDLKRTLAKVR